MAGLLGDIGGGLINAGAALNPLVMQGQQRLQQQEQEAKLQQARQLVQNVIQGVQSGAIPPEQGRAVLQKMGLDIPMGPSLEAQKHQQEMQANQEFLKALPGLGQGGGLSMTDPRVFASPMGQKYMNAVGQQEERGSRNERRRQETELGLMRFDQTVSEQNRNFDLRLRNAKTQEEAQQVRAEAAAFSQRAQAARVKFETGLDVPAITQAPQAAPQGGGLRPPALTPPAEKRFEDYSPDEQAAIRAAAGGRPVNNVVNPGGGITPVEGDQFAGVASGSSSTSPGQQAPLPAPVMGQPGAPAAPTPPSPPQVVPTGKSLQAAWVAQQKAGGPLEGPALVSAGAQVATGMPLTQAVPGFMNNQNRESARSEAIRQIKAQNPGMSDQAAGEELANRRISYVATGKSVGQLTTMLGATRQAVDQLDFNVNKTTEAMDKLPDRLNDLSPVINAMSRGVDKWTGDPAYSELYFYMHAAAMESARILQGGQASIAQLHQGAANEAKKWADANWTTPKQWKEGVAPAMKAEGDERIKTYERAIEAQRKGTTPSAAPKRVSSEADYNALPSGAQYVAPDGSTRRKK